MLHQSQPKTRTRVLAQSVVQETCHSLTGKWVEISLDVAALIPGLGITAAAAGMGLALSRGDYGGLVMAVAALLPLSGGWLGVWKLFGRLKKIYKAAVFAVRVNHRAAALAAA